MNLIEQLAKEVGFHSNYLNSFGEQVYANDESRQALLSAMGYAVENDQQIEASLEQLINAPWLRLLPATQIIKVEDEQYVISITVEGSLNPQVVNWKIATESGETIDGSLELSDLKSDSEKMIDGKHYYRYQLQLPKIAEGYHSLEATLSNSTYRVAKCHLIVAPKTCYGPQDAADYKMWGLAAQLYSLKSNNSWGIGDFSDLGHLVDKAAENGASTIGLNPLHPLFPGNTAHRSPYSPTSRTFLNSIYIDVTRVANFKDCKKAVSLVSSKGFQDRLKQVNSAILIDYPQSAALKYEVLELLYEHFVAEHLQKSTELSKEFNAFRSEFGDDLKVLATFDALYEHFRAKDFNTYGWTQWPEAFQDPKSASVKAFQATHIVRIGYFEFIQWIADQQLAEVANQASAKGMPVGLYLDLAVGCDGGGADVWSNRGVYVSGGSVGAPPDAVNLLGQDWGLTPINPITLAEQGFKPLVQALRSNMRHAGALRIDHVLGYMRQYWVAPGMKADQGIYITFPFEDMLRIIALESQRTECIVIGEDLGTTPDGFGEIMASAGLLSYRLLSFERWESGLYKRPDNYPEQSMVTVSTHDLPTLHGWWTGMDLDWREKLNLYPTEKMAVDGREDRVQDRKYLVAALQDMQLLDNIDVPSYEPPIMNDALAISVQGYLAKAPSKIQLIPLEDALDIEQQVNIPGTIDEHPNWLQRLPYSMDEIWQQTAVNNLISVMQSERPKL